MFGIIVGLIVGIFAGVLIYASSRLIDDCFYYRSKLEKINKIAGIAFAIAIIVASPFIGFNAERDGNSKFMMQYSVAKQTIESSLENEKLSGLERLELVNLAIGKNEQLAGFKFSHSKWYGFAIDDRIEELEYISFS